MSTMGYGVWFDITGDATFDINASSQADILVDADAEKLRILLFTGPEFPKILNAFTAQGRPLDSALRTGPLRHGLGRTFQSDAQLQETVDKARSLNLPAAVVVGGSSGIGQAAARHLHHEGYKLIVPEAAKIDARVVALC